MSHRNPGADRNIDPRILPNAGVRSVTVSTDSDVSKFLNSIELSVVGQKLGDVGRVRAASLSGGVVKASIELGFPCKSVHASIREQLAEALGAELILTRGASDEDLLWWLSYSWSRVEDSTGEGNVPRSWDQSHTLKGGVSLRWRQWDFSLAGEVHTGWPRTELYSELLSQPDGSTSLSVSTSRRNAFRHALSHSLDMRISRDFDLSRGTLTAFLEVTNLYNQENACCMEYSLAPDGSVAANETHWLPLVPSLGIVWRF